MRPVVLRMDGFAAFRERCVVDFTGADYFVLVGPTGAGKSTVIDAMTFALYGSVPRWDDRRAVRLALAPTAGRGTVSLVFDVGGERYVVARELRRAASGSVTVKEARLERLVDPTGTGEPGADTIPVEDGSTKVSDAVQTLLGMPFEDFCTCVVLPQGDFADFLHAAPRDRQDKLERILGLGVYDRIMRRANSEAGAQQQRADVFAERLERYGDDTAEADAAAARRVRRLERVAGRVGEIVPQLATAGAEVDAAHAAAGTAAAERAALAAVSLPDGAAELDARRVADAERAAAAAERADSAERADADARAARAAAPDRTALEQAVHRHAELSRLIEARAGLVGDRDSAAAAATRAVAAVTASAAAQDAARAAADTASGAAATAAHTVATLVADREVLAGVQPPDGLDDLAARRDVADAALERHGSALADAEAAEERARAAVAGAPEREPLEQALRDHESLAAARDALAAAGAAHREAATAESTAGTRRDAARRHLDHTRAALADAERADLAAVLRPALTEGDECPVCAQTVAVLPPPLPDGEVSRLRRAAADAERADESARAEHHRAQAALAAAGRDADLAAGALERLESAVRGMPDADGVREALADRERRIEDAQRAAAAVRTARRERDAAAERAAGLRGESDRLAARLQGAREPLARMDDGTGATEPLPPAVEDPVAGWRALLAWAGGQLAARDASLPAAREAERAAVAAGEAAAAELAAAREAAAAARRDETDAVRAEQEAVSAVAATDRRVTELRELLDGAPTADRAGAELERIAELDRAADAADAALRTARAALAAARDDADRTAREVDAAWDALRAARETVVALGPPPPDGPDLDAAGTALARWAADGVAVRDARVRECTDAAAAARARRDALLAELRSALAGVEVPISAPSADEPDEPDRVARHAPTAVATALAEARADRTRIVQRRAEAAELSADLAAAREKAQVAKMLADQLRSDRFPRWLVASALDALVADASTHLDELSGGQFSLAHDKGEFLVVDHVDADALRPVKTLSGGETFQASLALALALSDQLSGLAAQGAPRLESIFLDEGFGTLDDANLEIVATSLENLAGRGDRMVGVITHVAALAERIPVRYTVSRTQRSATIERTDGGGPG